MNQKLVSIVSRLSAPPASSRPKDMVGRPDLRKFCARRLKEVIHREHFRYAYEHRGRKYGSYRFFTSHDFSEALQLPEGQFNQVIKALTLIKKISA